MSLPGENMSGATASSAATIDDHVLPLMDTVFNDTPGSYDAALFNTSHGIVSNRLYFFFSIVNYVILCVGVSLFGVVANSVNILVFIRQGFKETINISFVAMANSDLILHITTLWVCVCYNPWLANANSLFQNGNVLFVPGVWIHVIAMRTTSWITAFVTLERCLCIVMPLKVKYILSPGRTKIVILLIVLGCICCVIPIYFSFKIKWDFDSRQNRSVLTLRDPPGSKDIQSAMFIINNVISPLSSFVVVCICTVMLITSIYRNKKWRSKVLITIKEKGTDTRDQKVIKMITTIAAIYIACYTPAIVIAAWMAEDERFSIDGLYRNLLLLLTAFAFLFESVNSSLNIFIYYNMSSKFRETMYSLFGRTMN